MTFFIYFRDGFQQHDGFVFNSGPFASVSVACHCGGHGKAETSRYGIPPLDERQNDFGCFRTDHLTVNTLRKKDIVTCFQRFFSTDVKTSYWAVRTIVFSIPATNAARNSLAIVATSLTWLPCASRLIFSRLSKKFSIVKSMVLPPI